MCDHSLGVLGLESGLERVYGGCVMTVTSPSSHRMWMWVWV